MELENGVIQEVAAPETVETVENTTVEEKPTQTPEENAKFADYRRKTEAAERRARQFEEESRQLYEALKPYGVEAKTLADVTDHLRAQASERPIEEIRAERAQQTQVQQMLAQKEQELERFRSMAIDQKMKEDLKSIQKLDPTVKDLNSLGEDFLKLVASGVGATVAFQAVQATKTPVPKDMGKLNSAPKIKDFYSSAEVDKLTPEEMKDPQIRDAVRKSMMKW